MFTRIIPTDNPSPPPLPPCSRASKDQREAEGEVKAAKVARDALNARSLTALDTELESVKRDLQAAQGDNALGGGRDADARAAEVALRQAREDLQKARKERERTRAAAAAFTSNKRLEEEATRINEAFRRLYTKNRASLATRFGVAEYTSLGDKLPEVVKGVDTQEQQARAEEKEADAALKAAQAEANAVLTQAGSARSSFEALLKKQVGALSSLGALAGEARGHLERVKPEALAQIANAATGRTNITERSAALKELKLNFKMEFVTETGNTWRSAGSASDGAFAYESTQSQQPQQLPVDGGLASASVAEPATPGCVIAVASCEEMLRRVDAAMRGAETAAVEARALPRAYEVLKGQIHAMGLKLEGKHDHADAAGVASTDCPVCARPFASKDEAYSAEAHLQRRIEGLAHARSDELKDAVTALRSLAMAITAAKGIVEAFVAEAASGDARAADARTALAGVAAANASVTSASKALEARRRDVADLATLRSDVAEMRENRALHANNEEARGAFEVRGTCASRMLSCLVHTC